jgi:hypothetical protein
VGEVGQSWYAVVVEVPLVALLGVQGWMEMKVWGDPVLFELSPRAGQELPL